MESIGSVQSHEAMFPELKKGGVICVKIPLLFVGLFLTLSAISQAGPARGGFNGGGFHAGFGARGLHPAAVHGVRFNGGGFQRRFIGHRGGSEFGMRNEIHRDFADRRFFRHNRPIFFQQFGWPVYWYPYTDPLAYSYLEPNSDSDYQYWDNSSADVRPESTNQAVPQNPMVVVINNGNARPTYSSAPMDPRGDGGYVDNGYVSASAAGQQRMIVQDPNEQAAPRIDSITQADPVVPQAIPVTRQNTQTPVKMGAGVFGKFVVISWLEDGGKDVIFVKNIETNDVQRITSQPNIDHFRIVAVHPNANLTQFEAVISNGSDQGAVRFQF
jgi:hypothetical protein